MHKYPKLLLLCISFLFGYELHRYGLFELLPSVLNGKGYLSVFLGGLLFSFGFTTPIAIFLFVDLAPQVNPFVAAPIAGFGAMLADMTIFEFVRFSVMDEVHRLASTRSVRWMIRNIFMPDRLSDRVRRYLLWSVGGIVIASPLPDEIGVSLLSGVTSIDAKRFSILCFALNTLGIFAVLWGAKSAG